MKKFCTLIAALAVLVSCQKPPSEEEKKAEVEKQVQERLAAERQKEEQARLAQIPAETPAEKAAALALEAVQEETPLKTEKVRRNVDASDPSEERSTDSYGTFYRKLEPYGAWRETSDYGYVWQPREAEDNRNWRPYTDGHWVYTDAGWTWVSEEAFGWATYHYGRWVRLRRVGWVWVPGQEWAPAWVSWRTSKDYVGWAPLPPEARFDRKRGIQNWADNYYDITPDQYVFVPGNDFGARQIQTSVVPVEQNITIVIETTNVTNITYSNTTVVNQGPNYEEMRARSRQPMERFRLKRQMETTSENSKPIVRGEVLEMSAPLITRVPGIDRPQKIKERLTDATVEKTWAPEKDRAASERARAKMKAEVTPPPNAPSRRFVKPTEAATTTSPAASTETSAAATPLPAATTRTKEAPVSTPTPSASVATSPVAPTPVPAATTRATVTPAPSASFAPPSPTSTPQRSQIVRPTSTPPAPTSPSATPRQPSPTLSAATSPSATPRRPSPTRPPRPSPSITPPPVIPVKPDAAVTPQAPSAISAPSVTPDPAAQLRRFHPPASPRPSVRPPEPVAKSTPAPTRPVKPVVAPRITPSAPVAPPPTDVPGTSSAPAAATPSPAASPVATKAIKDPRKTSAGKLEDDQPRPIPTPTPPSQ